MALIGEMKKLTVGNSTYSITETDPTVPAWAKAQSKPSYTASEVGAVSLTSGYATDSELLDATTIAAWQDILGL